MRYLQFAKSSEAPWSGNFRDLLASVTRMATLADSGRIGTGLVDADIQRLQWLWQPAMKSQESDVNLDALLSEAVIRVCRDSSTLSEAGRRLFNQSRAQRSVINDADRLRKYLLKFGLTWEVTCRAT